MIGSSLSANFARTETEASTLKETSTNLATNQSENSQLTQPTSKSSVTNKLDCTNIGHRLLQKMGWSTGTGLGKERQGRVDHVVAVANVFRRGLGCDVISGETLREAKKAKMKARKAELKAKKS